MDNGINWKNAERLQSQHYLCGHCGRDISSNLGYHGNHPNYLSGEVAIYICHVCTYPTFFDLDDGQVPGPKYGQDILEISDKVVHDLYDEARRCFSVNAYTSTVMCCRKLLMNVAVKKKAPENRSYAEYVKFLDDKGYIPPDGKPWVDKIRILGNEANHEIHQLNEDDAKLILNFTGTLLYIVYQLPAMLKAKNPNSMPPNS